MLNKLLAFLRRYEMVQPGDRIVCAVSGGADSMALLFAMYLIREKLQIQVEAAHFNHGLRGAESDRDEAFVKDFCRGYGIPLHLGSAKVEAGDKGLEAAARDARYGFLRSLPGKIATAHTANDNAETVLMHMIRGTGLKGLGGITPVSEGLIRPMLSITRRELLVFLEEYGVDYVEDSSNSTDAFLRNRVRHHITPLLEGENPRFAENISRMALGLREDEALLEQMTDVREMSVDALRQMLPAQRSRVLSAFLRRCGVREPEKTHIALAESLVFSPKPSARANFPGGVCLLRRYGYLEKAEAAVSVPDTVLNCPGITNIPELGMRILCTPVECCSDSPERFALPVCGQLRIRSREAGDCIRLPGGTKSIKKLFVDRKIPADRRMSVPVVVDENGILGVFGIGANRDRMTEGEGCIEIRFEKVEPGEML